MPVTEIIAAIAPFSNETVAPVAATSEKVNLTALTEAKTVAFSDEWKEVISGEQPSRVASPTEKPFSIEPKEDLSLVFAEAELLFDEIFPDEKNTFGETEKFTEPEREFPPAPEKTSTENKFDSPPIPSEFFSAENTAPIAKPDLPLPNAAAGAGEQFTLPVRIFKKDKNNLQLPSGNLTVNRSSLQFVSATSMELNFYIVKTDVIEVTESVDEFGIACISLKAKGKFGGKSEKRTVRLYSEQTLVKPSKKEFFCSNCTPNSCPCQSAERAIYEILNRWRTGDFTNRRAGFRAVLPHSQNFAAYQADGFSMKLPENWQALIRDDRQILAAPFGAFNQLQSPINYSHGISAFSLPNPNGLSLNQLTDNFLRLTVEKDGYLKRGAALETNLRGGQTLVNKLSGFSPVSLRDENITIYTLIIPSNNNLLIITTVTPPGESADYKDTFRRILGSLTFSE